MKPDGKKIFFYLIILPLAAVGLYAVSQTQFVKNNFSKLWNFLKRHEIRSSVARIQKIKGVDYKDKPFVTMEKLTQKTEGKWIVSGLENDPEADSNSLDQVLYSVSPLDVVQIKPGTYEVSHFDIKSPILIEGLSENPSDVILQVKSKSLIEMKDARLKKIEWRNLTIRNTNETYTGGFISFRGVHALFRNCELLMGKSEIGLEGLKGSILDLDKSYLASSHRGTAISLSQDSKLLLSRSTFKSNKTAVQGDPDFNGKIRVDQSLFDSNRSAGISTYGGNLKVTKSIFKGNMVGIQMRRNGEHVITSSQFTENETTGIELQGNTDLKLEDTIISGSRGEGLLIYENVENAIVTNCTFRTNGTGIRVRSDSGIELSNSTIEGNETAGITLSKDSLAKLSEVVFDNNNIALDINRSQASLQNTQIKNALFGIKLKDKSQLKGKNPSWDKTREKIRNEFGSSLVELE